MQKHIHMQFYIFSIHSCQSLVVTDMIVKDGFDSSVSEGGHSEGNNAVL